LEHRLSERGVYLLRTSVLPPVLNTYFIHSSSILCNLSNWWHHHINENLTQYVCTWPVYFHTNARFAKHHLNKPKTVFCLHWIFSRFLKTKQCISGCYPLFPLSYVLSRTIICIPVYQWKNPLSEINTAWYHCNKCLRDLVCVFLHKDHKINA